MAWFAAVVKKYPEIGVFVARGLARAIVVA